MKTRRLVALAFLVALSTALHYFEGFIPLLSIPGYRLGLSNLVSLFALYYYGIPSFLFVSIARVFLVALIASGFGPTFRMSLSGCLFAIVGTLLVHRLVKGSIFSVSAVSALFHSIGQLTAYAIFFQMPYIFVYLALLGPISIATGLAIAFLDRLVVKRLPSSFREEESRRRKQ